MSQLQAVVVPRDLYYHEVDYVRGLERALRFARGRIVEDQATMRKLAEIFPGDDGGKMAQAREIQDRVDAQTFAIIDAALNPSN